MTVDPNERAREPSREEGPRDRLRGILARRSFRVGSFVLAGGAPSRYYVDARRTTLHPEGMALTGELVLALLREHAPEADAVGGLTMGADPIAYAVAFRSWLEGRPIEAFTVRKEPKDHGGGGQVEGEVGEGSRVVVVEDTLTTGSSALKAVEGLQAIGARVLAVITLVDREEGGRERLADIGIPVHALFTARELARERREGTGPEGNGPAGLDEDAEGGGALSPGGGEA